LLEKDPPVVIPGRRFRREKKRESMKFPQVTEDPLPIEEKKNTQVLVPEGPESVSGSEKGNVLCSLRGKKKKRTPAMYS